MNKVRLVGRLDIKGPNLIKGVRFEGLRVMGDPEKFAMKYYEEGIDEITYIDTVASLYGRNNLLEYVKKIGKNIIKVKNVISFLNSFAKLKREKSSANIIAITGSAGKTSLKNLLGQLLKKFGETYFSPKSFVFVQVPFLIHSTMLSG